ncbi:MAG: hypothetical protein JST16_08940 [Bdellovibrionales bacterium]|nr:hypothetical protein [Bdellovibrionales bacterium]
MLSWLLFQPGALRRSLWVGISITVLEGALLLVAAMRDGNFYLPNNGLGLIHHYGVPAILFADFGVLALLPLIIQRFIRLPRRLPVSSHPSNRRFLRRAVGRAYMAILLRGPALRLFLFFAGLGVLFLALNAYQTTDAVSFYGRDVFDSAQHPYSYAVMRLVLGLSWIILYPYVAVVALAISGNIYRSCETLISRGRLQYRTFHPDGCVGFATFGTINFLIVLVLLLLYVALTTVSLVHHKPNILQESAYVILSTAFVIVTFAISWPVTRFLFKARRSELLSSYKGTRSGDREFAAVTALWIWTVRSFSPYSAHQKILLNVARLVPVTLAGVRFFLLP